MLAVTPAQIQAAAKKYLTPDKRAVLEIQPAPRRASRPEGGTVNASQHRLLRSALPLALCRADGRPHQAAADTAHSRRTNCRRSSKPSCPTAWASCWWRTPDFRWSRARINLQAGSQVRSRRTARPRRGRGHRVHRRHARRAPRARSPKRPTPSAARSAASAGADSMTISGSALSENLSRLLVAHGGCAPATPTSRTDEVEPLQAEPHPEPDGRALASPASWPKRRWRRWCTARRRTRTSRPRRRPSQKLDSKMLAGFRDTYLVPNNATLDADRQAPGARRAAQN